MSMYLNDWEDERNRKKEKRREDCKERFPKKDRNECPQLPGTVFRIFIPAGAVINLLNILEVTTPAGICLIVRVPLFDGKFSGKDNLNTILDSVKKAGGSVEIVNE